MSDHDTHWSAKAAWMRDVGATDAAWSTDGALVHLRLGPPVIPPTDEEKIRATQPSISPQERERLARQERRDLVARSSGGPVPRLDVER